MNTHFSINNHSVHLWRAFLSDFIPEVHHLSTLLSRDELARAERFRFALHQQQFIIARALLRKTLSLYNDIPPEKIEFYYGTHGKPYLTHDAKLLQFNTSHSDDMVVYAITHAVEIGVDIEKIKTYFNHAVAKRFFNESEFSQLMELSGNEQLIAFYTLWSRKEALIKAVGEGLYTPLNHLSMTLTQRTENISLNYHGKDAIFYIESFAAHPEYQSAFALPAPIEKIFYGQWTVAGHVPWVLE